jgi:membrane protein insertase Oxa1/YidC/SpoIIIJ
MSRFFNELLFQPLVSIYAFLFGLLPAGTGVGWRLISFSILINVLLMPLYAQMEGRSRKTRARRQAVAREVARIKQHFRGRERYFYIRTTYRQHKYRPFLDLLDSADLFVQILVFATVYRYLTALPALAGRSFGPIADLGKPDGLLMGVNLLPFVMTALNAMAAFAYVDDRSKRTQALVLGLLFLVLLYPSPAGVVLYWTTNNLFSLARNLLSRLAGNSPVWLMTRLQAIAHQR